MQANIELEELTNYDEACYRVKEYTTEPEIEGKTIVCDLFIKTLNMPALTEWDDEEKPYISELYIVPKPEFISIENKEKIIDDNYDEFIKKYDAEFFQLEVINYGLGIRVGGGMESYATEKEAIEAMKNNVIPVSTLIGFFLDKSWNGIGTTGWDSLRELVYNVDQFNASWERVRAIKN